MMKHINNEKINSVLKLESKEVFNSKEYPYPFWHFRDKGTPEIYFVKQSSSKILERYVF
jgi:hypothetical protein